jgi:hypothetical protein
MRRMFLGLVMGFMVIGSNGFAANGDLIVSGNLGIPTISESNKLTVTTGDPSANAGIHLLGGTLKYLDFSPSCATSVNGLVTAGDQAIIFSDGTSDSGNLVIGPNTTNTRGIRIIGSNGRVGIGTDNPTYKLYVNGGGYATSGWFTSDIKFKEAIEPITSPLEKIRNIRGVSFTWKTGQYKDKEFPGGRHYGVIAQEIEAVLPEVVNDSGNEKAVSYSEIIPVLIEAIKEQQKQIDTLKAEVAQLKQK